MTSTSESKIIQQVIEFPDNRLMIDLCGQLDSNLAKIEYAINVQILRRGNWLKISGQKDGCDAAIATLKALYSRLRSGYILDNGDIEAVIRMPNEFFCAEPVTETKNSKDVDLLSSNLVQIITKKKTIIPRTKKQKEYIYNF